MRISQIVSIFAHREAYKTGMELEAETAATGRTTALTGTPTDAEKHTQAHQAIRTTPNIKLMRKTTTFLCTLALTTGAWAQQTAADDRVITSIGEPLTGVEQVTDGGVYVFHCNSANQDGYVTTATPADGILDRLTGHAGALRVTAGGAAPQLGDPVSDVVITVHTQDVDGTTQYSFQFAQSEGYIANLDILTTPVATSMGIPVYTTTNTEEAWFTLEYNTNNQGTGFKIKSTVADSNNRLWLNTGNPEGSSHKMGLTIWTGANNAQGNFTIYPVTLGNDEEFQLAEDIATNLTPFFEHPDYMLPTAEGGKMLSTEDCDELRSEYDALVADPTTEAYNTLLGKVNSAQVSLSDGGYFRIHNAYHNKDLTINADKMLNVTAADTTDATQVWQLTEADGNKFTLRAQGCYAGNQDQTYVPAVEESAAVTFYLGQCMATDSRGDAEAQWFIDKDHAESVSTNDDANHTALYVNADGTNVNLRPNHWGASAWYIIKAPTLSFSIGTAGYATAQFDFAVQLPVGMTAYTATGESDNAITLEAIDGGLVPAKTPVLLEAAEGDYTLNILSSDAASLDGNLLKGSLLPLTIPAEENAYILALDDNSQAAFFRVSQDGRDLARNKAYYVSTQATAESPSLALDFGKPAVGIDNAITPGTQAPETYYDLQGRRVLYPSNGIFVTADGQKVFIK